MLDTLTLVKTEDFREWARQQLNSLHGLIQQPLALYAVTKPDPHTPFFNIKKKGQAADSRRAAAGSATVVASLIFELSREAPHFLAHPSIEDLRHHRIKNIVLIDDSSVSGGRLSEYTSWFLGRNNITSKYSEKLRSWLSGGLIDLHILTYSITEIAQTAVLNSLPGSKHPNRRRRPGRLTFHYEQLIRSGGDWSPGTPKQYRLEIPRISRHYADKHGLPSFRALGFEETLSYVVFEHSAPNNLPAIFNCRSKSWTPMFENRSVGTSVRIAFQHRSTDPENNMRILEYLLEQPHSTERRWISDFRLLLFALTRYQRTESLVHTLGMHPKKITDLLNLASYHGLVVGARLTAYGRAITRRITNKTPARSRPQNFSLTGHPAYVPSSFRADQRRLQP